MFTGIITKTAKVRSVIPGRGGLVLGIDAAMNRARRGDSVSVNGVCSTVKEKNGKILMFEYIPESLRLSNLSSLKVGDRVNLEESLGPNDKFHGHIVLGHIDGKGEILNIKKEGNSRVLEIKIPSSNFRKFLVYKGSVALEGVSFTVTKVSRTSFFVKIIPYTLSHTNLKQKKKGDLVNLEFDIIAKYANKK